MEGMSFFFVTHMIPGYTELYVIVTVSVYLSLDQYGNEYSVASTCFLDWHAQISGFIMIMVHPWKSHRVLLWLVSPMFVVYPQTPLQNMGGFTGFAHHPCWVSQPSSIKKSTDFIPRKELPFQPPPKETVRIWLGFSVPKKWNGFITQLDFLSVLNGRNSC